MSFSRNVSRHRERSEAIQGQRYPPGLLRRCAPRNDGVPLHLKSTCSRMGGGRLPAAHGKDVVRALEKAGFIVDRIVSSHRVMVFPGDPTRTVKVPVHGRAG